ncbi:oligosaccharide flippase family protein [Ahrensia sp. 13_GOM-1096m]|uniref:oligosaccharide flippase family protein n=1 Tax=Ahrensia sp. 13_GOM-1096m TaxID=1380380 RepID=UPI0006880529|nr:oligosaccharide flippase family protein [Ahrensia sp. 13_GOM-1096m]
MSAFIYHIRHTCTNGLWRKRIPASFSSLLGDGSWTIFCKIYAQVIQLSIFIFAAHILAPAEFGFFAFASAIAVILVVLSEGGWREFILKTRDCTHKFNDVATISMIAAVFFTAVALSIAAVLAFYFDQVWEGQLVAFFSLWILPAALSAIYEGLLISKPNVKAHSLLRISGETIGIFVAVGGLWVGWNVAALVAGRLTMQLTYLLGAMVTTKWVPRFSFERKFAKELFDFSKHILLNRIMLQIRSYAGTLVIGTALGLAEAGLFRAAERIVAAISELIGDAARMLAWIILRRADRETEKGQSNLSVIGKVGTSFLIVLTAIATPIFLGLALVSNDLVRVLLGDKWAPAGAIVALLCFKQIFLMPSFITETLLSITGNLKKMPPVVIFNVCVSVGMILICAPFGVLAIAAGQFIAAMIAFGTTLHLQGRYGGVAWAQIFRESFVILVAAALMSIAAYIVGLLSAAWSPTTTIVLQTAAGAMVYFLILFATARARFNKLGPQLGINAPPPKAVVQET